MCNCIAEVQKEIEDKNGIYSVKADINAHSGRVFTTFTVINNKGDRPENIPMPCKYCPFCGEKFNV